MLDGTSGNQLGLGTWDEDTRPHRELYEAEAGDAREVLQWFPLHPSPGKLERLVSIPDPGGQPPRFDACITDAACRKDLRNLVGDFRDAYQDAPSKLCERSLEIS